MSRSTLASQVHSKLKRLLLWSLLDWLPILVGHQPFQDSKQTDLRTANDVRALLKDARAGAIDELLRFVSTLVTEEDARRATVEAKATMLIGGATISTGLLTGFAGLILGKEYTATWLLWLTGGLFGVAAFMYLMTMTLSMKCLDAMSYRWMAPAPADVVSMVTSPIIDSKRERIVDLYRSYVWNRVLIDRKVTFTRGAQAFFVRASYIAFVAAILAALLSALPRHSGIQSGYIPPDVELHQLAVPLTVDK